MSVKTTDNQAFSLATLLPQLKVATDQSNAKLTQRQVRIANLVKGEGYGSTSVGLLNDPSSLTIKTKLGMSDGIRSTKAFMTSVTPGNKNDSPERDGPAINFAGGDLGSPNSNSTNKLNNMGSKKRKVFGANDYLERQ